MYHDDIYPSTVLVRACVCVCLCAYNSVCACVRAGMGGLGHTLCYCIYQEVADTAKSYGYAFLWYQLVADLQDTDELSEDEDR
jgi:hypothetical protein